MVRLRDAGSTKHHKPNGITHDAYNRTESDMTIAETVAWFLLWLAGDKMAFAGYCTAMGMLFVFMLMREDRKVHRK